MTDFKHDTVTALMEREGWDTFTNDPDDLGRETKWGITEALARDAGYTGAMEDMGEATARRIYDEEFWKPLHCDALAAVSPILTENLFDFGVNGGKHRAVSDLQRCLNALNNQAKLYPDVMQDGLMGPATESALKEYRADRGGPGLSLLVDAFRSLRIAHYVAICESREKNEKYMYGWLTRAMEI